MNRVEVVDEDAGFVQQQGTMTRRRWLALVSRIVRLVGKPPHRTADLVRQSYDRIADGYDHAWTDHMRVLSLEMLDRLAPFKGAACVDLACGTGFLTAELMQRTGGHVCGVDSSPGMLRAARSRLGENCTLVQADVVEYLRSRPPGSADIVTCGWALGYAQPWAVIREAARVLRPGGRIGIIDNTLFSLAGVLWASILTFAEDPEALVHVMQVRFLPASWCLALLMRRAGLGIVATWDGSKTYRVPDGDAAVARLTATGAAAGFEFAADEGHREAIFARFAEILERRYRQGDGIPITHQYLAAVGRKT